MKIPRDFNKIFTKLGGFPMFNTVKFKVSMTTSTFTTVTATDTTRTATVSSMTTTKTTCLKRRGKVGRVLPMGFTMFHHAVRKGSMAWLMKNADLHKMIHFFGEPLMIHQHWAVKIPECWGGG